MFIFGLPDMEISQSDNIHANDYCFRFGAINSIHFYRQEMTWT